MFVHSSSEKRSWRGWIHWGSRSSLCLEISWLRPFCHLEFRAGDEQDWTIGAALPGLSCWLTLTMPGLPQPRRYSPHAKTFLPESRQFNVSIHDWMIRFEPWSRWGEWNRSDPWWVRGVTLNLDRCIFGKQRHALEKHSEHDILIPMPEGNYQAKATFQTRTWTWPRWFTRRREETDVEVLAPGGVPHRGKGENSWDCGDDGLCGYSVEGHNLAKAIARGVEIVLGYRKRYGMPSESALAAARPKN